MKIVTLKRQEIENDLAREISKEQLDILKKNQGCAGLWKVRDNSQKGGSSQHNICSPEGPSDISESSVGEMMGVEARPEWSEE